MSSAHVAEGSSRRRRSTSDPLSAAIRPPEDETSEQLAARLNAEKDAGLVSENIDEMLRKDAVERKKAKAEVNVLLLGQSESGKSTTLKQFQLLHTPAAFHAERIAWRTVIYLNLVRSVRRILDAISPEQESGDLQDDDDNSSETASVIITSSGRPPSAMSGTSVPKYEYYRDRLQPLIDLENRLTRLLSSPDEDEATHLATSWKTQDAPVPMSSSGKPQPTITIPMSKSQSSPVTPVTGGHKGKKEVSVHTTTNWKKAFALGSRAKSPKSAHSGELEGWWEDPEDPVHALNACSAAMIELWRDESVRQRLTEKRVRLEESSGFYLDEIPRITATKYIPTDADVLRARLKTLGVVEHTFSVPTGTNRGVSWKIFDVGGARNQRQAWAPYFEDINAIIFLAPISAFDQVLQEDTRVNRLEDSLVLWKSIVSNKLLAHVNLVLFLNKCDLLQTKLDAGVRLNRHMISYGDRPNDYDSVSKYFKNKFGAIHQTVSPNKDRELYVHFTTVTDTRQTTAIIATVRDIIIKTNLRNLKLV